ncbi:MAG: transketolase [Omnitrophica WOR_2 bacterium RIFCSPLOWO2_12_FULL_51_24]|nr:MAG: transketolase [Omnitrophica WOR_2 bacterium RIFCSPLOWO2_02_FULL_50_19]OGX42412.1 MAG: transketolase [Omnitrophica WOR_2 bacterium RIFCSPLOWO2_12_FULL_51_24]
MANLKPTRDGFGEALVELGKINKDVVVLSADLTASVRANWFKDKYPERFFNFGVAEQDMISTAAGFALSGKVPFACTFGIFASGRAWDQIRLSVCYMNLNVKISGTHGGISVGPDGASHQALEEITLMRVLPNMTVIVPCDSEEARLATLASASYPGPIYLRLGREPFPIITDYKDSYRIGKALRMADGSDITIIGTGVMVQEALKAHEELKKRGISARLLNLHTVKPIDKEEIIKAAIETGAIVTAEEHTVVGGMGSAVSEVLVENCPVPMRMVGIKDRFGESGDALELMKYFGLSAEGIVKAALEVLKLKK